MKTYFLDTETTGLAGTDEIISLCFLDKDSDVFFHKKIKALKAKINRKATEVHGITNTEMKKFVAAETIKDELYDYINGTTLIAHNMKFDLRMLNKLISRLWKKNKPVPSSTICTLNIIKSCNNKVPGILPLGLGDLQELFSIKVDGERHDAYVDCKVLKEVYSHLSTLADISMSAITKNIKKELNETS